MSWIREQKEPFIAPLTHLGSLLQEIKPGGVSWLPVLPLSSGVLLTSRERCPRLCSGAARSGCVSFIKEKNVYALNLLIFHVFSWPVAPAKASAALLASSGIVTKSILSHWMDLPNQLLLPDDLL